MRILITTWAFAPRIGGTESLIEMLADMFVAAGHEVRIVTRTLLDKNADTPLREFPYEIYRRPSARNYRALCRWADVNLYASLQLGHLLQTLLAGRRPVIQHNYDYTEPGFGSRRGAWAKMIAARLLPGIAVSPRLQRRMAARDLILNPYDNRLFRNTTPWEARALDLVFLGRLTGNKGCHVLLEAMDLLAREGINPSLSIIGDGPERDALQAQAERLGLIGQVRFLGFVQDEALVSTLNEHRIIVVPSTHEEGFGLVAVEGLACGTAVVATDAGGLPAAVNGHGVLFPMGDRVALAQAIKTLHREGQAGPPACLSGVEAYLEERRVDRVAADYLDILARYARPRTEKDSRL